MRRCEEKWDCNNCGTTRISKKNLSCPDCNFVRLADVIFYKAFGPPIMVNKALAFRFVRDSGGKRFVPAGIVKIADLQ